MHVVTYWRTTAAIKTARKVGLFILVLFAVVLAAAGAIRTE
jgi:hypothetical protein